LRLKHNIRAEVCQLTSGDYIVSNRMAVKRKTASGKSNLVKFIRNFRLLLQNLSIVLSILIVLTLLVHQENVPKL